MGVGGMTDGVLYWTGVMDETGSALGGYGRCDGWGLTQGKCDT